MAIGDGEVVEFTKEAVKAFLDKAIRFSRKQRDRGVIAAVYYVDAFQSVRASLFDELLGDEEEGTND